MSHPLPVAVALTRGINLRVIDLPTDTKSGKFTATGKVLLQWAPPDSGQLWRVERIVVTAFSAVTLGVTVYVGDASAQNLRDWTEMPSGWSAIAEYPTTMTVDSGTAGLAILFTGGAVNDVVVASIQYQQVVKVYT